MENTLLVIFNFIFTGLGNNGLMKTKPSFLKLSMNAERILKPFKCIFKRITRTSYVVSRTKIKSEHFIIGLGTRYANMSISPMIINI